MKYIQLNIKYFYSDYELGIGEIKKQMQDKTYLVSIMKLVKRNV